MIDWKTVKREMMIGMLRGIGFLIAWSVVAFIFTFFYMRLALAETPYDYAIRKSDEVVNALPKSVHVYERRKLRRRLFKEFYEQRRQLPSNGLENRIPRAKME